MDLNAEKVVVITGGASGIGRALADAFGRSGCKVVLADVQEDALAQAVDQLRSEDVDALGVRTDVSKLSDVEALAEQAVDRFGAVHVVCNNAGVAASGDPWSGPLETWEWTMGVNLWGVVYGVRTFLPHILAAGEGHIVNTASIAGLMPGFSAAYDASKHAVVALTENLYNTMQTAGLPIGVSCLCPAWVRTGIIDADRNWPSELGAAPTADIIQETMQGHVRRAIDEGMQPAAVADLVLGAINADRFWVFPHPDFVQLAMDRFHQIGAGHNPDPPENIPGMPPRSEIIAEVMAALEPATTPDPSGQAN